MEIHWWTSSLKHYSNCIFTIFIVFQNERYGRFVCCNHNQTPLTFNAFLYIYIFWTCTLTFTLRSFNYFPVWSWSLLLFHTHTDIHFRDVESYTTKIPYPVNVLFKCCLILIPYHWSIIVVYRPVYLTLIAVIVLPLSFFERFKKVCNSNTTLVQYSDIFFLL